MNTALLIRDNLSGFRGYAALYRCDPPMAESGYFAEEGELVKTFEYVIASTASVMFSGLETYLFGADAEGNVADWGELPGSSRGDYSHADVLRMAGYTLVNDGEVVAEYDVIKETKLLN